MRAATNTLKSQTSIIAITLIVLMFSSCTVDRKSKSEADFAKHGISVAQLAGNTFKDLNNTIKEQQYQKEFIKIVNDLSPETYIMKSETDYSAELKNVYKINAFRNLERVFTAYNLQFDSNISAKASGLGEKISTTCNSLDSLNLNENLKAKNEQVKKHIKSTKFRTEEIIYQLTSVFAELWIEESQRWFMTLAAYQEETDKGIKRIPTSAFNTEKLKTMIEEPYSDGAVLANLYKLKMIKENQIHVSGLQEKMHTITESFDLLIAVQGELMKRKKDKLKVEELNNRLGMLLEN